MVFMDSEILKFFMILHRQLPLDVAISVFRRIKRPDPGSAHELVSAIGGLDAQLPLPEVDDDALDDLGSAIQAICETGEAHRSEELLWTGRWAAATYLVLHRARVALRHIMFARSINLIVIDCGRMHLSYLVRLQHFLEWLLESGSTAHQSMIAGPLTYVSWMRAAAQSDELLRLLETAEGSTAIPGWPTTYQADLDARIAADCDARGVIWENFASMATAMQSTSRLLCGKQ